jgi:hypothetical protein
MGMHVFLNCISSINHYVCNTARKHSPDAGAIRGVRIFKIFYMKNLTANYQATLTVVRFSEDYNFNLKHTHISLYIQIVT